MKIGSKVVVRYESLRTRKVRVNRGEGRVIGIHPGRNYGKWPAYLIVKWANGQTTDIKVDHVCEIEPITTVDISNCPILQEILSGRAAAQRS